MKINHPIWGEIQSISYETRPEKVWKHFYNPNENWSSLVGGKLQDIKKELELYGQCSIEPFSESPPDVLSQSAFELIHNHHNQYYEPAYMGELIAKNTMCGEHRFKKERLLFCTPKGVLIPVGVKFPKRVLTAYRPLLPFNIVSGREQDYANEARSRWCRGIKKTMTSPHIEQMKKELIVLISSPIQSDMDCWHFVRTVGQARMLLPSEDLEPLYELAEQRFHSEIARIQDTLEKKICYMDTVEGLVQALREEDLDVVSDRLLLLEDILLVSEMLEFHKQVESVMSEIIPVISWGYSELMPLLPLVESRLDETSGVAQQMWEIVFSELVKESIHVQEPQLLPEAKLTHILLSNSEKANGFNSWIQIIRNLGNFFDFENALRSVRISPSPVLLREGSELEYQVSLEGSIPEGHQIRLFVIDEAHQHGLDLTEHINQSKNQWSFDAWCLTHKEDEALILGVVAKQPINGELLDIVEQAKSNPEIQFFESWVKPPK